jgi:glutathione S-transferase
MNKRLATRKFLCGTYSIADMACWGWVRGINGMTQGFLEEFPNVKAWMERIGERPATKKGFALGRELRQPAAIDPKAEEERRKVLFGQRARA